MQEPIDTVTLSTVLELLKTMDTKIDGIRDDTASVAERTAKVETRQTGYDGIDPRVRSLESSAAVSDGLASRLERIEERLGAVEQAVGKVNGVFLILGAIGGVALSGAVAYFLKIHLGG